jgi:ERCC4-type nuclease
VQGQQRVVVDRETAMRFDRYVMGVGMRVATKQLGCGDVVLANVTSEGIVRSDTLARLVARLAEVTEVAA